MKGPKVTVDFDTRRFNKMLDAYLKYSGRSFTNEVNKRGFNICLKAAGKTPKVSKELIKNEMEAPARIQPPGVRKGKPVPLAAILTNYHRGKKGKKGMWGEPMKKAVKTAIAHRQKGRGFMAAGWLGTAADIGLYVRPPREVRGRTTHLQIGKAKGVGKPERRIGALQPKASGRHGSKASGNIKGAKSALRYAVNAETRDMIKYLRRKIPKDWAVMDRKNAAAALASRKL
jgi:hypothetical protein